MRRKQQVFVPPTSPPKSIGARIFSSLASLLLGAFLLLLSFIGVLALGWTLEKLFPQHESSVKFASSQSTAVPGDVQSYFNAVGKQVKASGTDLGAIVQLSADARAKPALLRTPDWHKRVDAACTSLQAEGQALQNIVPVPADCAAMNADVHRAGQRYEEIARRFSQGADIHHPDTQAMLQAVKETDIVVQKDDKVLSADSDQIRAKLGK